MEKESERKEQKKIRWYVDKKSGDDGDDPEKDNTPTLVRLMFALFFLVFLAGFIYFGFLSIFNISGIAGTGADFKAVAETVQWPAIFLVLMMTIGYSYKKISGRVVMYDSSMLITLALIVYLSAGSAMHIMEICPSPSDYPEPFRPSTESINRAQTSKEVVSRLPEIFSCPIVLMTSN